MISDDQIQGKVVEFANKISSEGLRLVPLRPEPEFKPLRCFYNVKDKIKKDGGDILFGWYFGLRRHKEYGFYVVATHHAVWISDGGYLYDVTPAVQQEILHPIMDNGRVLFLADTASPYVNMGYLLAPLPNKFYAIEVSQELDDHLDILDQEEKTKMQKIYSGEISSDVSMEIREI